MDTLALIAQVATPEGLAGSSGWFGAGLLGLVLAWVFFVHLPRTEKHIREVIAEFREERDLDRQSRHDMANSMQATIVQMSDNHDRAMERREKEWNERFKALVERRLA